MERIKLPFSSYCTQKAQLLRHSSYTRTYTASKISLTLHTETRLATNAPFMESMLNSGNYVGIAPHTEYRLNHKYFSLSLGTSWVIQNSNSFYGSINSAVILYSES
jgi:hypothetical protein